MPFPTNGSYPVLGCSRPGEVVQSKPKKAIFVRMSPEALKALQDFPNNPPMEFEFGDNPGIHIGDQHFNINAVEDTGFHDLYLRASSATKKNPPFKLYANVKAKFTVQRELLPSVGEKVRESTNEAMAQRASRTAVIINDPQALNIENQRQKQAARQSQKKKKADAASLTGASNSRSTGSSLLDKAKNKAVASAARTGTAKATLNPLDRLAPERVQDIKRRLIHYLAPEYRSQDEVVRAIGGANIQPQSRQVICHLLEEVGEPVGKPGSKYCLKLRSWKDLRPYEWEKYTESVRTKVCREACKKLSQLGVSESDPLWGHFRSERSTGNSGYASPIPSSAQAAGRRGTPEPKRPLMSSDFREKEREKAAAIRARAKGEIRAKDESRSGRASPSEMSRVPSSSSSSVGPARKQAGTGFKAPSSKLANDITRDTTPSRKTDMRPPATPGRDSPSASSVRSDSQSIRPGQRNRERAGSVQDSDTERRRANQVHQSSRLAQRPKLEDDYQDSDVERRRLKRQAEKEREREREKWEREKEEKAREKEKREREREKERRERERERERERARESDREQDRLRANGRDRDLEREKPSRLKGLKREREEGETSDASNASLLKRRARPVDDDDEYQPSKSGVKRRKTDAGPAGLPPKPKVAAYPESRHERSYSRQSDISDSSRRIKRESPLPPPLRASPSSLKRARSPVPPVSNKRVAVSVSRDSRDVDSRSGSLKPKKSYNQENSDKIYTDSSDSEDLPRRRDDLPQSRATSAAQRRADPIPKVPEMPTHPSRLTPANHESSAARNTRTPLHANGNGRVSSQHNGSSRPQERLASLQREYEKKFYAYDDLWRSMDAQQRAIKKLVRRFGPDVDSVSEDDNIIMNLADVERGVNKLRRMADELVPLDREIRHLRSIRANEESSD